MNFLKSWFKQPWPKRRMMPSGDDIEHLQALYAHVFNTPAGNELLELWLETVVLENPRSTDANECIAFAAKCAFVEDVIKAVDRANNPSKYQVQTQQRRVA